MNPEYKAVRLTTSGSILVGPGFVMGVFVASGTPTIKVWDNTTAAGTVYVNTFQTAAATYYNLGGGKCVNAAFATLAGAGDVTFFVSPKDIV